MYEGNLKCFHEDKVRTLLIKRYTNYQFYKNYIFKKEKNLY